MEHGTVRHGDTEHVSTSLCENLFNTNRETEIISRFDFENL